MSVRKMWRADEPVDIDRADYTRRLDAASEALHGAHPAVQGAIIADLLSIWLAGHLAAIADYPETHGKVVDELLTMTTSSALALVEPNLQLLLLRLKKEGCAKPAEK